MIVNINVILLYMITLFLMLFFGLVAYKMMNNLKMGLIFGELFILCISFLILPSILAVVQSTVIMYILVFLLALVFGIIAKAVWNTPGMMIIVQILVIAIILFLFSGIFGVVG